MRADEVEFYNLEVRMRKRFGVTVAAFFKEIYVASKSKSPHDGWVLKDRAWLRDHHGFTDSNVKTARKVLKDAGLLETRNGAGNRTHWKILPRAVMEMFYPDPGEVGSIPQATRSERSIRPGGEADSTSQRGGFDLSLKEREVKEKESVAHDFLEVPSSHVRANEETARDDDHINPSRNPAPKEPAWLASAVSVFEIVLEEKGLTKLNDKECARFGEQFAQLHRDHGMGHDTARAMVKRMCDRWHKYRLPPVGAYEDVTVNYPNRYPPMTREQFRSWRVGGEDEAAPHEEWRVGEDGTVYRGPSQVIGYVGGMPDEIREEARSKEEAYRARRPEEDEEDEARKHEGEAVEQPLGPPPAKLGPSRLAVKGLPVEAPDGLTYEQWEDYKREAAETEQEAPQGPIRAFEDPPEDSKTAPAMPKPVQSPIDGDTGLAKTGPEIVSEFADADDHALGCDCGLCTAQAPNYVTHPCDVTDLEEYSRRKVA